MTDKQIIQLYFDRSENAISETKKSYGKLLQSVAYNILRNLQDAEECENEACLKAWNSIPPNKPQRLCAYLCKIARRIALDRYDYSKAAKRGEALPIDDLYECLASAGCAEDRLNENALSELVNGFLAASDYNTRVIFLRRFWFGESIADIAKALHTSQSMVKSRISRTLKQLREYLKKEGYDI
ncbi:MAG: RNA polymerase sigma factor [Oscillospiraceae bacterium]|nr:RNA polymerase sigma factor [Oscillospiraceae bacterium]